MTDDIPTGPQKATKMLPKDPNFEVKQFGLHRGGPHNIVHGLYRKDLTAEELPIAEALAAEWSAKYDLDDGVDRAQLMEAIVAFVKSRREAPRESEDHNQKDAKVLYSRLFKEHIESLGINRKNRKGNPDGDALAAMLSQITKKPAPIETEETSPGVFAPKEATE